MYLSILKGWVGRGALSLTLLAGAVAVFLMMGGLGEGQERCPADVDECIEYEEHGSGAVVVFTALDPEEEDVEWGLATGNDAEDFRINEGRLTFRTPPDFEDPKGGTSTLFTNVYLVTIQATDTKVGGDVPLATGRIDPDPATRTLQVTVTNVEEPGEVELTTLQPQEGVAITATLTDPDGITTSTAEAPNPTWQWSRSTRVSGGWTDIEDDDPTTSNVDESETAKTAAYMPTQVDVGMYLRATATYIDGKCEPCEPKKTAQAVSANPVQADPRNKAPKFLDENGNDLPRTDRSVAENTEAGTVVGAPVTATDPGFDGRQETLTYALSGAGSRDFDIDSGTGQIRVKAELNYEDTGIRTHQVTVRATDPSGGIATVDVTITVTDVDEAPTITTGSTSVDYEENTSVGTEVAGYATEDPDGDASASLKWSLSGRDAAKFAIGNRTGEHGRLTFREAPDYEAPTDSDRDNVYEVTVEVADRGGNKATRDVTVHVENEDEPGLLTVSNLHPQVGTRITPTLTEPDTPISNMIWTWEIGGNVESRANAYTPKPADEGRSLEVSITYTDGTGERQTLSRVGLRDVQVRGTGTNQGPRFSATTLTSLTVRENRSVGEDVGGPVTADDPDNDSLTYSISGGDGAFSIEQDTGQIKTRVELDREKRSSYRITVTAEDPSGERDTHSLTIAVDDVDEAPVITSGDVYIYYAENGRATVDAYRADDPEGKSIEWSLTGVDLEHFTFVRGVLKFKNPPDYEDEDEYTVTVNAGDGNADNTDTEEVAVVIINVDEKGTVTFGQEPKEGTPLTAELMDPDGSLSNFEWQWARSSSRSGGFTDIRGATSASHTPVNDDTGNYLQATVTYTDAQGGGKSAYLVSNNRTQWKESGPPEFRDSDGEVLSNTTREVEENARAGTNVGAPVAATDIGNRGIPENLTYELSSTNTDADSFDIDPRTGQIKVKRGTTLDHESDKKSYVVTVAAKDPSGGTDTVDVTITVVDVNETPELTLPTPETNVVGARGDLNSGFTHSEPVADADRESGDTTSYMSLSITFEGDDPETPTNPNSNDNSALTWTLAGTDADDFEIRDDRTTTGGGENEDGVLRFKDGPDFEAATDSGRNNVYEVTVQATDEAGNTASQKVKITVENVGEDGVVALSHTHPEVDSRLTASLTDPDKARSPRWQWYRSVTDSDNVADGLQLSDDLLMKTEATKCDANADPPVVMNCWINRATSSIYIPNGGTDGTSEDYDDTLTVVATYSDGEGSKKVALGTTANFVRVAPADDDRNDPPVFQDSSVMREVSEDADPEDQANNTVGTPVFATDDDSRDSRDTLVYSLSAGDVRYFTIDATDANEMTRGQIRVRAGTELDYETKKSYRVTVKAVDPSGRSDTITVDIDVTDVDETPTLSRTGLVAVGRGSISYPENGRDRVADYSALGPNAGSVSWRLGGPDASDFSINSRGALTFRSTPNFEKPADSDKDNTYELTVTARSGRDLDELDVTVDVFNVDEEGEVTLSPTRGTIGARITAELTDPDGALTSVSWEWSRSETGVTGWTPIPGTNSDRYTLDAEDRGYYLQATAYYTDPEGGGKSASARTTAAVRADDDGRVTLTPASVQVGTSVTARLTDPDGNIRNVTWQWASSESRTSGWLDIPGTTSSTYTTAAADVGNFLRATARYDDGDGPDKAADAVTTAAVVEDDDGVVTLSPTGPSVGERVIATLTDPDGGVTRAFWQWASSSNGTSNWTDISGANSATYTAAAGVLGSYLRATVIYDDAAGVGKSAEAITVAAITVDDDGSVALSPTGPSVGDRVTATLTDPDGGVTGVTWTWASSPNGLSGWRDILNATSATYTPVTTDVGRYLRATATYTDVVGPGKSAEAVTAAAITADDDGSVTLSPTGPSDGDRVTARLTDPDGGVTGVTWTWASSPNGLSGWRDILNATSATYTPVTTDVGRYLRATASYTDAVGPGKSAQGITAAVSEDDDGTVTLSTRTPEVGSAVTATLNDPDGGVRNVRWQWEKSSNGSTGWTDIQGATSGSYTPGESDAGIFLRATVSYDDAVGTGKSAQAATSSGVAQMELLSEYDANRNESIERSEAIRAVSDYFDGEISKDDVLAVLVLYFSG